MKILKILAIAVGTLVLVLALAIWAVSEPLPEGKRGPEAEALANKMLDAINKQAYDSLSMLRWSFPRGHHFAWNKAENKVNVQWGDLTVDLDPEKQSGAAYRDGVTLTGKEHEKAIHKAWALFANDSFWLTAPFKIKDPGTERLLVATTEGPALLVTYTSGGVTPGDSYLWILDKGGRPVAYKMWVSILPWKGVEFSWENWTEFGDAWFAPVHQGPGPISVNLSNLEIH